MRYEYVIMVVNKVYVNISYIFQYFSIVGEIKGKGNEHDQGTMVIVMFARH